VKCEKTTHHYSVLVAVHLGPACGSQCSTGSLFRNFCFRIILSSPALYKIVLYNFSHGFINLHIYVTIIQIFWIMSSVVVLLLPIHKLALLPYVKCWRGLQMWGTVITPSNTDLLLTYTGMCYFIQNLRFYLCRNQKRDVRKYDLSKQTFQLVMHK
jgi:hypothetical protein